jgi:nicotinate phosphoribosyltransferase
MSKTMLTDLYQLTMNAAYVDNGKDDVATFDLFIRNLPKDWGYFIANGIEDALDIATNIKFEQDDIDYLRKQKLFSEDYLSFLKGFSFKGDIYALKEGTPVFPDEPILRVTAKRTEAQFLETVLLNTINFQTLIASKASRVVEAAKPGKVVDFGLRRAQEEDAAMKGARAAYLAGAVATSNVKAGKMYGIPISGTHAHSFVMSFPTELEAFRAYAKTFPDKPTLLIDTYDTLEGAKNAAIVGKELEGIGGKLGAVRLDSGDLIYLSKKVRTILDDAGLSYVRILASNDLNEYKIGAMKTQGARIDGYGVGTEMITAKPVAAISGVYKLVEDGDGGKMKLSPGKRSSPGKKQLYRVLDDAGHFVYDVLALEHERIDGMPLLERAVADGKRTSERRGLSEIRAYAQEMRERLPDSLRKTVVDTAYEVRSSTGLRELVQELTLEHQHVTT